MARAGKGMGHDTVEGHRGKVEQPTPPRRDRADIADDMHGSNKLQGEDQQRARNQRQSYPDSE